MKWSYSEIQNLIKNGREESLILDYKSIKALIDNGWKSELAKDVSAFANSAGGTIIYGVVEEKHKPINIEDGLSYEEIKKETIENVLLTNIQPKISGLRITPVDLPNTKQLFVIDIPASLSAPHMANHRFYKRHEFSSTPMEHYEVFDVANRHKTPDLSLTFDSQYVFHNNVVGKFSLKPMIQNKNSVEAHYAYITLSIDKRLLGQFSTIPHAVSRIPISKRLNKLEIKTESNEEVECERFSFAYKPDIPIFTSIPCYIFKQNETLDLRLPQISTIDKYYIHWEIESPRMVTNSGLFQLSLHDIGKDLDVNVEPIDTHENQAGNFNIIFNS